MSGAGHDNGSLRRRKSRKEEEEKIIIRLVKSDFNTNVNNMIQWYYAVDNSW